MSWCTIGCRLAEVRHHIGAKRPDVRQMAAVGQAHRFDPPRRVPVCNLLSLGHQIVGDVLNFREARQHLLVTEANGADVDVEGSLDAPALDSSMPRQFLNDSAIST